MTLCNRIKSEADVVLSTLKSFIREASIHFQQNNSHVK